MTLHLHHEKNLAYLTLNRAEKCNALNQTLIHDLQTALRNIAQNETTHVLILQGSGKHFCAGADLNWMKDGDYQNALALAELLEQLANLNKTTIALTHGKVMGGGCGLAACCDFVIASETSHFCFPEVKLGLSPVTIAPYILRRIGYQKTKYYFLTAAPISAAHAVAIQLVDKITSQEELLIAGQQLAEQLCKNPPHAIAAIKQQLNQTMPVSRAMCLNNASALNQLRHSSPTQTLITDFLKK